MDEIFKKLKDSWAQRKANADATMSQVNKDMGLEVNPGDESQFNDTSNLRNIMVDKLGLDPDWKMNLAEEKNHYADLPKEMGMAAMGSIGKVDGLAEQALAKLTAAKNAGQRLKPGLELLRAKATGEVPVVQALGEQAGKKASTTQMINNAAADILPNTKSMDQILMEAGEFPVDEVVQKVGPRFKNLIKN